MSSTIGPIVIQSFDILQVKYALIRNGFYDPSPLQTVKKGQVFGLVKRLGDLEMHVRGYGDNSMDSEIELSRDYLEHPGEVRPYYGQLLEILDSLGISYVLARALPPDPQGIAVPQRLTPWKPIAAIAVAAVGVAVLAWLFGKSDDENED